MSMLTGLLTAFVRLLSSTCCFLHYEILETYIVNLYTTLCASFSFDNWTNDINIHHNTASAGPPFGADALRPHDSANS